MNARIEPRENYCVVKPLDGESSSFTIETKKYDRKAIGVIMEISKDQLELAPGDKVVYDDSHSVDFVIGGKSLSVIGLKDVVATIKEGDR